MSSKSILIMAGGTGGHVYPALAIAEYLREQGFQPFWLGTRAGLEARVVPANSIPLSTIKISGLRGKGVLRWLLAPINLLIALVQSLRIINERKPAVVIGLGGFVSGPGGVAAWLLRKPLFIHEQNAIPGLTNRLLTPLARTAMQGFPNALNGRRVITTGNPVRKDILFVSVPTERMARQANQPLRLLVLGGSLGAKVFNDMLPDVIRQLPEEVQVDVWHQTGVSHFAATAALYQHHKLGSEKVMPYIEDMAGAYAWADLVLCRSGALTISELCVVGVASILVPYPYAADDHQTANAKYLSESGGALLIPQPELTVSRIVELLCQFYKDRNSLLEMAICARNRALPHATEDIAAICMEAVNV
jgi:UDP-N-acetylglucosamine--N-acetylmuramyl-(pentapeptide) pyrophosphoryl-undecaprenol N-acetylglucosamine transferase